EGIIVSYKGEVIASGEAKAVRNSLDEIFESKGTALATNLEKNYLRVNALSRWGDKIDPTFYNHLNGEFNTLLIESRRTGYKMEVLVSEGGHSSAAIGKTIRLKGKPIPNPPRPNQPYRTKIYVKYRDGWLEKEAMSSMFPSNWDLERIKQEIAFVYENTVAKGVGQIPKKRKEY
ncbi:EndoU domain-containing protein, partial [Myroides sp. 1354]|nr:EndoU domain-containing protein [Myroides sp. R163-1]MDM1057566.1 EndoU domain-containing protein [Myroides sp. 1354]MDM1070849.1 EndoU domain-containing protein [Myroides sp. 1372]